MREPDPHANGHARATAERSSLSMPKSVTIFGATGSIGTSTLDLVARNPDRFTITALTAHRDWQALARLALDHRPKIAVIADAAHWPEFQAALAGSGVTALAGSEGLAAASDLRADIFMAAIVGAAGLVPTFAAAKHGTTIALANKECLVAAGDIFMAEIARTGATLLPVDSEHSAAFQAMAGGCRDRVEKVVLTASGGPFRTATAAELAAVTPEQAVKHPKWSMGQKISVDSATLMNKGLELIEAKHLFGLEPQQLGVVVHPQSIIHCLVYYADGSVLAQMACPDMRVPIAYSLAWPDRLAAPVDRLDLAAAGTLSFEAPDEARFPALRIAREAMAAGGAAPAVLNAANEVAVAAFLDRRLSFLRIPQVVAETVERVERTVGLAGAKSLADVLEIDRIGRQLANQCADDCAG